MAGIDHHLADGLRIGGGAGCHEDDRARRDERFQRAGLDERRTRLRGIDDHQDEGLGLMAGFRRGCSRHAAIRLMRFERRRVKIKPLNAKLLSTSRFAMGRPMAPSPMNVMTRDMPLSFTAPVIALA